MARRASTSSSDLLAGLNPEQRRAVTTTEGPLLVLAGAGTGKTRVVTLRIARLLERGSPPESILAVTFTNKAAGEMRERVAALVGRAREPGPWIGTFHSFCLELLRAEGRKLGLPARFGICDASDQLAACKGALRELHVDEARIRPGLLQARISLAKSRGLDPERLVEQAADDLEELVGRAWRRYEDHLARSALVDFDDLLLLGRRLLRDSEEVREGLRARFRHVMVDEFQDTNQPQFEIVGAIAAAHRNLCVVGDDDQSIYGWRGADVSKILGFERDFPGAAVVRLETNYRSTAPILEAANRVIRHNPTRHEKSLRSAAGEGAPVRVRRLADEVAEADQVARELLELRARGEARFSDVAVLFRTGTQPRVFEEQLRARGVPYVLVGGLSFFDRKEVRDLLAWLKLAANPEDELSFLRVVNCPPRGIGRATLERLIAAATARGVSAASLLWEGLPEGLPEAARAALEAFRATLQPFTAEDPGRGLVRFARSLVEAVDYQAEVRRCYPDEKTRTERWAAVGQVLDMAENHVRRSARPSLRAFLQDLTLAATDARDEEEAGEREALTLMTLHAAKGLEFRRVYLVGWEEGLFPHLRAVQEDSVEEERRLAYVGITRAREHLTISWAESRSRHGRRVESHPSRFLLELEGREPPCGWRAAGLQAQGAEGAPGGRGAGAVGKAAARKGSARKGASKARKKAGAHRKAPGRRA